jgi:hypothetical protein
VPLGLLTNGPPDIQRFKIDHAGLADYFDATVISGETGIGKPARAAFALVAAQLGVDVASMVMVGDSWERDVLGALQAGSSAVWIAGGRNRPEALQDVAIVDVLADILPLFDSDPMQAPGRPPENVIFKHSEPMQKPQSDPLNLYGRMQHLDPASQIDGVIAKSLVEAG